MNKKLINSLILILVFTINPFQKLLTAAPITPTEQVNEPVLKQDYHYFYDSTIFDSYLLQFKTFANQQLLNFPAILNTEENSLFVKQVINFIESLQTSVSTFTPQEKRVLNESLMMDLRAINLMMENEGYNKNVIDTPAIFQAIEFIESCNLWIFTQADLMPSMQAFLCSEGVLDMNKIESTTISTLIENTFELVNASPSYQGSFSVISDYSNFHFDGFIPSAIFKAFSTQFIWIPRMAIENLVTKEISINPAFLSYLRVLKQQGKKHLYVNLMKRNGSEELKTRALEDLARDPLYSGAILVLTLDMSSDFYWQEEEFSHFKDTKSFKKSFMKHLFYISDTESQFYWPKHINADLKSTFSEIINNVHSDFFDNREVLSSEERQIFIEICYVKFIERFCKYYKPDYVNVSCKFSMDRGPSLLAFIYAFDALLNHSGEPEEPVLKVTDKIQILTTLFAPPILSHNRPPHDYRINQIRDAIQFLEKAKS